MKNESKNSGEKDIARSGSAQPDNLNTGIQGRGHFINRISDWLSPITIDLIKSELALHKTDNLTKSELRNLQREISFSLFPNDPEPIGIIDSGYLPYFNDIGITDNIIYSGKAYFVDHALFSHPEIKTEEFEHLLDTLSEPDLVKQDDRHGSIALLFIKKFNKFFVEVIRADEEKRLVLHKTFYYKDKVPQKALPDVEPVRVVPEGGHSSIDPA